MSFEYKEMQESRIASKTEDGIFTTRRYTVTGAGANDIDAVLADLATLGIDIGDAHPTITTPVPIYVVAIDPTPTKSDNISFLDIKYEPYRRPAAENGYGETYEWDLVSQITHITNVDEESDQVHYPIDHGTAIGVDGENVNGADVYRPAMSLRISKHVTDAEHAGEMIRIQNQLNTLNNATFEGYVAGEVIFIGTGVKKLRADDWLFSFNFLIGRKRTSFTVDLMTKPDITQASVTAGPWDVVSMTPTTKLVGGVMKRGPESVHVAVVYDTSNFANFGFHGPTA